MLFVCVLCSMFLCVLLFCVCLRSRLCLVLTLGWLPVFCWFVHVSYFVLCVSLLFCLFALLSVAFLVSLCAVVVYINVCCDVCSMFAVACFVFDIVCASLLCL